MTLPAIPRCLAALLLCFTASTTAGTYDDIMREGLDRWALAEQAMVEAAQAHPATAAGVYTDGREGLLHLGASRAALQFPSHGDDQPRGAILGSYRFSGRWLELELSEAAIDPASITAEFNERLREEAAAYDDKLAAAAADRGESGETESDLHAPPPRHTQRLLLVEHAGGHYLFSADSLAMQRHGWDGGDTVRLTPTFWKQANDATIERDDDDQPVLQVSLSQDALPFELSRIFRRDALHTDGVAEFSADELEWTHHSATVTYRLDNGERHGLYSGMSLIGTHPGGRVWATVGEVGPDHAIATFHISRFHPDDAVELPPATLRFASEPPSGTSAGSCAIDYSAAVRTKVTAVSASPADLQFDEDGYAFLWFDVDQGAAQGLSLDDTLLHESNPMAGEGRVRAVQSNSARVLWRIQRYALESDTAVGLDIGQALVTPAWQRVEHDVFGDVTWRREASSAGTDETADTADAGAAIAE